MRKEIFLRLARARSNPNAVPVMTRVEFSGVLARVPTTEPTALVVAGEKCVTSRDPNDGLVVETAKK